MPARVAHSPQRFKDTIGLVIERQRLAHEFDCLRWYTSSDDSSNGQVLFERWFHCCDLTQLKPVIQEFVTSSEFVSRKPGPGSFLRKPVFEEASNIIIHPPISLVEEVKFLLQKKSSSSSSSSITNGPFPGGQVAFTFRNSAQSLCRSLFSDLKCTSSVTLYGPGEHAIESGEKNGCDLFLLQLVRSFALPCLHFAKFFTFFPPLAICPATCFATCCILTHIPTSIRICTHPHIEMNRPKCQEWFLHLDFGGRGAACQRMLEM